MKGNQGKKLRIFFVYLIGSTGEARGRYKRIKTILPEEIINKRVELLNEIRAMLAALIQKWE